MCTPDPQGNNYSANVLLLLRLWGGFVVCVTYKPIKFCALWLRQFCANILNTLFAVT